MRMSIFLNVWMAAEASGCPWTNAEGCGPMGKDAEVLGLGPMRMRADGSRTTRTV